MHPRFGVTKKLDVNSIQANCPMTMAPIKAEIISKSPRVQTGITDMALNP